MSTVRKLGWALVVVAVVLAIPFLAVFGSEGVQNGDTHQGHEVQADIPQDMRQENTVGTDNQGLCVWASTQMAANFQNVEELGGLFDAMKKQRGGGWPERVDSVMKQMAPHIKYDQFVASSWDQVDEGVRYIQEWTSTGRPVMITYGYGELYNNATIAHMVICVYCDDEWMAILDNNDIAHVWWMTTQEGKRRFGWPNGQAWAWRLHTPPPPPVPHKLKG